MTTNLANRMKERTDRRTNGQMDELELIANNTSDIKHRKVPYLFARQFSEQVVAVDRLAKEKDTTSLSGESESELRSRSRSASFNAMRADISSC